MNSTRTRAFAILAGCLFVAAYYPIFSILSVKWAGSDDYTHAFFTVPIILYMAWGRRQSFIEGKGWGIPGLATLVLAAALYILSLQLQIPSFIAVSMVLTVCGMILYLSGPGVLREMAIPLLLLVLLIPIPDQLLSMLTGSLQLRVSQASEQILRLVGVPLFREGNVLHVPEKTFQVVEACSGIRSLISLITLSLILGYFSLQRFRSLATLVVMSIPVAVLINIMRVVSLVLAHHYFKLDLSAGTAHTILGLVLFGIALAVLFALQRVLEQWETQKGNPDRDTTSAKDDTPGNTVIPVANDIPKSNVMPASNAIHESNAAPSNIAMPAKAGIQTVDPAVLPLAGKQQTEDHERSPKNNRLIILATLLLATCLLVYGIRPTIRAGGEVAISDYLQSIEGYTTEKDHPLSVEVYDALDLDDYMSAAYRGPGGWVSLYIGYYYSLAKVSAAHAPTACFPAQGWTINQPAIKTLAVGDKTIHYAQMVASIGESRSLVLYWHQAYHLTSPYIYRNKINTLINKFSGKKEDHAFVRVSVPFSGMTEEDAEKAGVDFIKAFYPKFIRFMDENDTAK